jgi:hypothetical protein
VADLIARLDTDVPPELLWDVVTDWSRQGEWIPLTTAEAADAGPLDEGSRVRAWTGLGRIGFWDEMVVRRWEPPTVLELEHVGRVVRGTAGFHIEPLGTRGSRITWWERISPPLGRAGALGWRLARPAARAGLVYVLHRLAAVASARAQD